MLTYTLVFLSGFALFLLGMSIFMYREGQKFGDNQFTVKLLPPPPKRETAFAAQADWSVGSPVGQPDFIPARKAASPRTAAEPGFSQAA